MLTLFTCFSALISQETATYEQLKKDIEKAEELYNHQVYGLVYTVLDDYLSSTYIVPDQQDALLIKATILSKRSRLQMNLDHADKDLIMALRKYSPHVYTELALVELADYYYNNKDYAQAIYFYDQLKVHTDEHRFKKGYCHFVRKEFNRAKSSFANAKDNRNRFFYPVNYYDGMSSYFLNDYDDALKSFQRVSTSQMYKDYVPYYITQIHFAQGKMDLVISYAQKQLSNPKVSNLNRIRLLLGQAYFKKGSFNKALPHLEYYEAHTDKLSQEEFYQLAFTQYQNKQYAKAAENFIEINSLPGKMGQVSNYYLADCYLQQGDKTSARTAFKKVADLNFNPSMQQEAFFNYGKLSAEEGYDTEAITTLSSIDSSSKYYNESQGILSSLLLRTKDYNKAIDILERLPNKSQDLKATYQIVTLASALQAYGDKNLPRSNILLQKSIDHSQDPTFKSQAIFWQAVILQDQGNHTGSYKKFNSYFNSNPNDNLLPDDSKTYLANYYQGYNLLKSEDYKNASEFFKSSLAKAKKIGQTKNRIYTDAQLRSADCLFKINRYEEAKSFYQIIGKSKQSESPYALYQLGIIEGLQSNPYEKIIVLEELVSQYPKSNFADDALIQLGDTYSLLENKKEAYKAYEKIIIQYQEESPLVNEALLKLGLSSYNQGDVTTALKYYKKVFLNNPNVKESNEALIAIEEIYIQDLGQSDAYFEFLENIPNYKISEYSKDSLNYKIAEIQYENGEYSKAVENFTEYINKFKNGSFLLDAHYRQAESLMIMEDYAAALPGFTYVVESGVSKYYMDALKKGALISYNEVQDFNKALLFYEKIIIASTDEQTTFDAFKGIMQSAYRIGDYDKAISYTQKVANHNLANKEDKTIASYYTGKISLEKNIPDQAIAAFNEVIKNNSGSYAAESSYLISKIFYDKGQLDQAELQCKSTNTTSGNYPYWIARSLLLMSDIYIDKKDLYNARAATEAVIENFQKDEEVLAEANVKLTEIKLLEDNSNRIQIEEKDGLLNLDQGNNE